jgi:hypothetical protein
MVAIMTVSVQPCEGKAARPATVWGTKAWPRWTRLRDWTGDRILSSTGSEKKGAAGLAEDGKARPHRRGGVGHWGGGVQEFRPAIWPWTGDAELQVNAVRPIVTRQRTRARVFRRCSVLQQGPSMPILLWYLPFTMFYGACDLLFAGLEMQVNEPADLGETGPDEEATRH